MSTAYQDLAEKIYHLEQRIARLEAERIKKQNDKKKKKEEMANISTVKAGIE
jgi:ribosome-binding protein aMBF1 (putative translation factor)